MSFSEAFPETLASITIVNEAPKKAYLGGYRHKHKGILYHNAVTQTDVKKRISNNGNTCLLRSRDTQTVSVCSRATQSVRECGTQMERSDLFLSARYDQALTVHSFVSSEEIEYIRNEKAVIIQRFWRGFLARIKSTKRRVMLREWEDKHNQEHRDSLTKSELTNLMQIQRRMEPRSKKDFEMLYNELAAWSSEEMRRIKSLRIPKGDRDSLLMEVVEKVPSDNICVIHSKNTGDNTSACY